ncbi:MAG TPA: hypothetical protein VFK87_04790 [Steroidobacteraceae bacterium]|nr:hypothetical protein [Steroidobacteraceae bacterium]
MNVTNIHNVYRETVVNSLGVTNTSEARASYTGPPGARMRPNAPQAALTREVRYAPTQGQAAHHAAALGYPSQNAACNEGRPPVAATPHPGAFLDRGVTAAKAVGPVYRPQRPQPRPEQKQEEKPGHEGERPRY